MFPFWGGKLPFIFWGELAGLVLGRVTFQFAFFNKIHEGAQGTTSKKFSWLPTSKTNYPINNLPIPPKKVL